MQQHVGRQIVSDGPNAEEALRVLARQVPPESISSIRQTAARVIELSVDPVSGAPAEPSDGLIYGMVQSGKTAVLTVASAMAADNRFQGIIVLTSDNDDLYDQTVERVRQTLRGITVLGKRDWRDANRFGRVIRVSTFAIVCSKNGRMLNSLLEAFQHARARGLSLFIVDDEADQASLNTRTRKRNTPPSTINALISAIRGYFPTNTYVQVTATPQALFLQERGHRYRPSFTVLSDPGHDYVGGDQFFGDPDLRLLQYVDLAEVQQLIVGNQPSASGRLPRGLREALCTFLVAAGARLIDYPEEGFAFLCHVSMSTRDHAHVLGLIDSFREEVVAAFRDKTSARYRALAGELQAVHAALLTTEPSLASYSRVEEKIDFYIRGAAVKLINAVSSDEIVLDGAFNFFVGGNKLGRGVTIKNLLVSYYGRNPRRPNADTVLQHARMYGYRQRDVGVTRLFLPQVIADNFRSIHDMDNALRELIRGLPDGRFEGLFLQNMIRGTRPNVVDPAAVGMYVAGGSYNPRMPLREGAPKQVRWLDEALEDVADTTASPGRITFEQAIEFLRHCPVDPRFGARLWNVDALAAALLEIRAIGGPDSAYLVVKRGRNLGAQRAETQGILSGGEEALAPRDRPALFLYRQGGRGSSAFWWPQLRFHNGNYAIAFPFGA